MRIGDEPNPNPMAATMLTSHALARTCGERAVESSGWRGEDCRGGDTRRGLPWRRHRECDVLTRGNVDAPRPAGAADGEVENLVGDDEAEQIVRKVAQPMHDGLKVEDLHEVKSSVERSRQCGEEKVMCSEVVCTCNERNIMMAAA
jgi:hypothetical protein